MNFRHPLIRRLVQLALEEDLGRGDVTTAALERPDEPMKARVVSREPLVVAGVPIVATVLDEVGGGGAKLDVRSAEGMAVGSDTVLCEIRAAAGVLLSTERVILNFLQRMSGVATLTRRYVEAVAGTSAAITDTRKTIPGWRLLDKYAVVQGGGRNHRFGLDDGILLKDNHIVAVGGVTAAIERARAAHHLLPVEVECDTLAQVDEAVAAGANVILLDNMKTADMAEAVARIAGRALVEASGGVTLARVREIAKTGVDLISVGEITHSAAAVDLSMELGRPR
ncbi:MAG: carboxylating nicotinate-nucleotide diphosphorylase [Candidatus Binatia bacterium]